MKTMNISYEDLAFSLAFSRENDTKEAYEAVRFAIKSLFNGDIDAFKEVFNISKTINV